MFLSAQQLVDCCTQVVGYFHISLTVLGVSSSEGMVSPTKLHEKATLDRQGVLLIVCAINGWAESPPKDRSEVALFQLQWSLFFEH